jgi:hypothetical protein
MAYLGSGRPPKYCSQNCRQRDYEVRTAEARRDVDAAAGRLREGPVRELVERTETVTRTVVRHALPWASGSPLRSPQNAGEWSRMLAHLTKLLPVPYSSLHRDADWPEMEAAIRALYAALEANPRRQLPTRDAPAVLSDANAFVLQEPAKVRPAQPRMQPKRSKKRHR